MIRFFPSFRTILSLAVVLASMLVLNACRESEQGRVLMYQKGTYMGKVDHPLSNNETAMLQSRTALQATGSGTSVNFGAHASSAATGNLGTRTQKQGGN